MSTVAVTEARASLLALLARVEAGEEVTLPKPLRLGSTEQTESLTALVGRLDLRPLDRATAELAVTLAAACSLRTVDAGHLATAVAAGADRFIINNRRDLPVDIAEITVTYPEDLPAA